MVNGANIGKAGEVSALGARECRSRVEGSFAFMLERIVGCGRTAQ
jgi:hypothetical protein